MRHLKTFITYLKEYKLIYSGILLCNFCCFNFYAVFENHNSGTLLDIIIALFFIISFVYPIILGVYFAVKCFVAKSKKKILINIIHSYIGTVLIFGALFYQCSVYGDFMDAVNKRDCYSSQFNLKEDRIHDLVIMRVADRRAFKGIKPRIWSGYDYPDINMLFGEKSNPDAYHFDRFVNNIYEDISLEQIGRIAKNNSENARLIKYQKQNVKDVYIDCLYFSVACISTVGFGDISPNLWFAKLFTSLEVFIGYSIFVFAVGILFSDWSVGHETI